MTKANSILQSCLTLFEKNREFFRVKEPGIYDLITKHPLSNEKIEVVVRPDSEQVEVDILNKGTYKYFGESSSYCQKEAQKFLDLMHPGLELNTLKVANEESFNFNRIGSKYLKKLAKISTGYTELKQKYPIPSFYPLVVITGIGLGYHIKYLLDNSNINNLIIYEKSIEGFITSLYTLDWEEVYSHFNPDDGSSLQLIIASNENMNDRMAWLWNALVGYCPHFPFTTFFYNHLSDPINKEIIDKINGNLTTFLHQWGHYDDEINQYNNARHNLLLGARVYTPSKFRLNPNILVAIIAGGPSLTTRIESLKKYKSNLILISCGSAIGTLAHYDLKPHFHVELESDYLVYEAIKTVTTAEFRKDIVLVGAAQLNPHCFNLFDRSIIFFKDSTALTELYLQNKDDIITSSTPTCTNAGIAFAKSLNTKNIYMFGTDFGFENKENHHAPGSIHYEDDIPEAIQEDNNFEAGGLITDTSVHGTEILTKPMYLTSKRRLEECIKLLHHRKTKVYNCSDGASIKNAVWMSEDAFIKDTQKKTIEVDIEDIISNIYSVCSKTNEKIIDEKSNYLYACMESVFTTIKKRNKNINNLQDLTKYCFIINNIITQHMKSKMGTLHFFIRGHIWIALSIIYSMSLNLKDDEIKSLFSDYTKWFEESSDSILKEMKEILFHNRSTHDDPWINTTVEVEK